MAPTLEELGIDRLSREHRLHLIGEIWDSLNNDDENDEPFTEIEKAELERRAAAADANPGACRPWKEVLAKQRASL